MAAGKSDWYRKGPPHWWRYWLDEKHGWLVDYWFWNGEERSKTARFWFLRVASEKDAQALIEQYGDKGLRKYPLAWEYKPSEIIDIASHDVWQPTEKVENET